MSYSKIIFLLINIMHSKLTKKFVLECSGIVVILDEPIEDIKVQPQVGALTHLEALLGLSDEMQTCDHL